MLDALWVRRAILWAGYAPAEMATWLAIWTPAADLGDGGLDEVRAWTERVRTILWGHPRTWLEHRESPSCTDAEADWAHACRILGAPLARWLANDDWARDAERLAMQDPPRAGLASLMNAARRRQGQRQAFMADIPQKEEAPTEVAARAAALCLRFGLTHFATSGDIGPGELSCFLLEASQGLTQMAIGLGWEEEEIGAERLGLVWDLAPRAGMAAGYDPLTESVALAGMGGWGSFAHEWAHALDAALGARWHRLIRTPLTKASVVYGSQMAESAWMWIPEACERLRKQVRARDGVQEGAATALMVHQRLLASLPGVAEMLGAEIPGVWQSRFPARIDALYHWVDACQRPNGDPEHLWIRWDQWRLGNRVAWSHPEGPEVDGWRVQWEAMERIIESLIGGRPLVRQAWAEWARAQDEEAGVAYADLPQERWARSFHAFMRDRLSSDSWVAGPADAPDEFPVDLERVVHAQWWPTVLPELRRSWAGGPV